MIKQFLAVLRNDFKAVFRSKQYLILLGSLLLYSFYINFIYSQGDIPGYQVYVYDALTQSGSAAEITQVNSEQGLYDMLNMDREAIGVVKSKSGSKIIYNDTGSPRLNNLKYYYAWQATGRESADYNTQILGSITQSEQKRIEMTSVVVFFEITAISFLSIAALFFKEKQMGIIKVYSILPVKKSMLVLSKIVVFLVLKICFVLLMGLLNLDIAYFQQIVLKVMTQILVLSPLMVLLGFMCSLQYRNFKQFVFAYTVIIVAFTSPVFLFVNTQLNWRGIRYFPTYHLYNNLRQVFFNRATPSAGYYLVCGATLIILYLINLKMINREMKRS